MVDEKKPEGKKIRFIDLFGGVGGFRHGLEKAGGFECVWYCDNDKYAVQTYNRNFHENWKPTDIRAVQPECIPDFDLLCAGFPCQSFSIAGKRKGFEDTRGTLFFEICRIAEAKRPEMLLLENVYGLLSHDGGRTFAAILDSLWKMGYFVEWQVLNSKHFGVPQNRERVFIVGHLGGEPRQKVFPLGEGGEVPDTELEPKDVCPTITSRYYKRGKTDPYITTNQAQRIRSIEGIASTLQGNAGGQGGKTGLYMVQPCLTPDRLQKRQNGRRFKEDGEEMFTLTGQDVHGIAINDRIRRLTPTECERLQGFPDGWTAGVSDTQRYRMMGNAVTTNVVEAIGMKISEVLRA